MQIVRQFLIDESGATAIEYAMLLGLITLAIVGALGDLRDSIRNMYNFMSSEVTTATNG